MTEEEMRNKMNQIMVGIVGVGRTSEEEQQQYSNVCHIHDLLSKIAMSMAKKTDNACQNIEE